MCLVTLNGGGKFEITQSKYRLTEEQKHDDGQKLFNFCADCVKTFINSNIGDSEEMIKDGVRLPLGFTVCLRIRSSLKPSSCRSLPEPKFSFHTHARPYPSPMTGGHRSEALTRFIQAREDRPWSPHSLDQRFRRAKHRRARRGGDVPYSLGGSSESLENLIVAVLLKVMPERPCRPCCSHVRYHRNTDRFCLRQSQNQDCCNFWYWVQRGLHGDGRGDTQVEGSRICG